MKIWFDNEGTAFGGRKYFAVVEEFLVDKDGNFVTPPAATAPDVAPETAPVIAPDILSDIVPDIAPAPVNENAELIAEVDEVIRDVNEYSEKVKSEQRDVKTQTVETVETVEKTENAETVEVVEKTQTVEATEATETAEVVEPETAKAEQPEEVESAAEELEPIVAAEKAEEPIEEAAASETPAEEPTEEAADDITEEVALACDEQAFEPEVEPFEQAPEQEVAAADVSDGGLGDINVAVIAGGSEKEGEQAKAPHVTATVVHAAKPSGEKAPVRSRNFAEKMRDADEVMQDRYDELKNYALRYRKLKARISKKFDSINAGRFQFVKLSIAGKTLKLFLNMDISTTDPKYHCKDMSDKKTYVTVPVLLRIKSGRAVKYGKRLIDQCAEQHGMLERRKPFVVDSMALVEEALKAREGKNADVDDELSEVDDLTAATEESLSDSEE